MTRHQLRAAALSIGVFLLWCTVAAQTAIKLPKNKYTPEQDVKLGREAADEVRKQYPVIKDERVAQYLTTLGKRLVAAAPAEFKQAVFEYSFTPVNVKEINAFALPGGPMFVNRGMFDAAKEEGEVVGVMAHELSHVLLRHGTANITKAQNPWLQLGQLAGAVGGAMVGGSAGSLIAQGSQVGLGAVLLRYSRDFEKQADLLGAQIMARAGYDPRALAHMFETIEQESKGGGGDGPQWMSSHPNPGNRTLYITKEAESLTIAAAPDTSGFSVVRTSFASLPPAMTTAEVERGAAAAPAASEAPAAVGTPGQPLPSPSGQYRAISAGKIFEASVPREWTPVPEKGSIKVVPQNGYGPVNGQSVLTCGVEFGILRAQSRDLREATGAWLNSVGQSNPGLKVMGEPQQAHISQRGALITLLTNPSPLGGVERIALHTTFLVDGSLFYYLAVAPEKDADRFEETFQRIATSIRLKDAR